jgi:competence protein ComEA
MKFRAKLLILLIGILLGLLGAGLLDLLSAKPRGLPVLLTPPPTSSPLRIHVTGAVRDPGVYTLPPGSIIQDAIEAAGGALPQASIGSINLAAPVRDGQQVYLTNSDEASSAPGLPVSSISTASNKINVNTVKATELESLPGIGPSLAAKIVEFRQQNGPFLSIEDLLNVPGIGPSKLEQIQDLVVIR